MSPASSRLKGSVQPYRQVTDKETVFLPLSTTFWPALFNKYLNDSEDVWTFRFFEIYAQYQTILADYTMTQSEVATKWGRALPQVAESRMASRRSIRHKNKMAAALQSGFFYLGQL